MKKWTKEYAGSYVSDTHRIYKVNIYNKVMWRRTLLKCGSTVCETITLKQAKQD